MARNDLEVTYSIWEEKIIYSASLPGPISAVDLLDNLFLFLLFSLFFFFEKYEYQYLPPSSIIYSNGLEPNTQTNKTKQ